MGLGGGTAAGAQAVAQRGVAGQAADGGGLTCPIDHRCADRLTVDRVLAECEVASAA